MQMRRFICPERTHRARGRFEPPPPLTSSLSHAHQGSILRWGSNNINQKANIKNSRPKPLGGFWSLSRGAPGANPAYPDQTALCVTARQKANPAVPSFAYAREAPQSSLPLAEGGKRSAARCAEVGGWGFPPSPRLGGRPPFNLNSGRLPFVITPLNPLHRNFPPSNTQPINPILSFNTEFHSRASSLSLHR